MITVKRKVRPRTGHEGSFFNLALDGVGGQRHAPAALPPGNTRYPLYSRLGGPQRRSGRVSEILPHGDSIPGPSIP
jgi:hypothetical protein